MTTEKKTKDSKEEGEKSVREKTPKPKENGKKEEKITQKTQGGSGGSWLSWLTTIALLGVTIALVVTVQKLNTQLASERKLYGKQIQELEADASKARTKVTVAESEKLDALSKVTLLENNVSQAKADAKRAANAKVSSEKTIQEVEILKQRQEKKLQEEEEKTSKLDKELSSVKTYLNAARKMNDELNNKIKGLEDKLNAKEREQETSKSAQITIMEEVEMRNAEIHTLNQELKDLQAALQKAEVETAAIKGMLKTNQEVMDATAADYGALERKSDVEIKKLKKDLTRHENDNLEKEKQLREVQASLTQLQQQAQQNADVKGVMNQEKTQLLARVQELEAQLGTDDKIFAEKSNLIEQKEGQLKEKETQIQNANGEIKTLRDTLTERDAAFLDVQTKWQQAVERTTKLEEELRNTQAAAQQAQQAAAAAAAQHAQEAIAKAQQAEQQPASAKPTPA